MDYLHLVKGHCVPCEGGVETMEKEEVSKYLTLLKTPWDVTKDNKLISKDSKLQRLLSIIIEKQKTTNKKIVIFSAYKDTVEYLFNQLKIRGFNNLSKTVSCFLLEWVSFQTLFSSPETIAKSTKPLILS